MSEQTKISWCDSTWNPWWGCRKISPGCQNCYIEWSAPFRSNHMKHGKERRKSKTAVDVALSMNRKPWICDECGQAFDFFKACHINVSGNNYCASTTAHRRRIFSLSLGDWLDDEVPIEWFVEMMKTVLDCDNVTWILCSKRWENFEGRTHSALKWMEANDCKWPINQCSNLPLRNWLADWKLLRKAPPNIIGLCSVENQEMADARIPGFLKIPLACRGLSLEPLLGAVDLTDVPVGMNGPLRCINPKIDWLIIGGESGPKARPCNVEWIRSLVQQGQSAGVATFVKQMGANYIHSDGMPYNFTDKKGGDKSEWPISLQVQQWPKGF